MKPNDSLKEISHLINHYVLNKDDFFVFFIFVFMPNARTKLNTVNSVIKLKLKLQQKLKLKLKLQLKLQL
jgi:hypothetical protein